MDDGRGAIKLMDNQEASSDESDEGRRPNMLKCKQTCT